MSDLRIAGMPPMPLDQPVEPPARQQVSGFMEMIKGAIADVNANQLKADRASQDLATGRRRTLHETMIELEKADLSFRMLMAVRGKVVTAYQEIMRMNF